MVAAKTAELPISIALNTYILWPFASSLGANWFPVQPDGLYDFTQPQFGEPAWQAYMDQLSAWAKSGFLNPNVDGSTALDRFQKGQSPFLITGAWDLPTIKQSGVPYAVSAIPQVGDNPSGPVIGVAGLILNPKGQCTLAATDFATQFMTTKDAQESVYKVGSYPPALVEALDAVSSDPDVKGFGEAAVGGTIYPANPGVSKAVGGTLGQTIDAILKGGDATTLWPQASAKILADLAADTSIPPSGN